MCDIGKFFKSIFSPGSDAVDKALATQTDILRQQADVSSKAAADALAAQQTALKQAQAAAVPLIDSESARRASEDRMRKLQSLDAFGVKADAQFTGAPPVGYRMLTGA